MKNIFICITLLAGILITTGCSQTDSEGIATSKIYARFEIESESSSGTVTGTARFQMDGSTGTEIDLSDGDTVFLEGSEMRKDEDLFGMIEYKKTVSKKTLGGTYTFEFKRNNESYTITTKQASDVLITEPDGNNFSLTSDNTFHWNADALGLSNYMTLTLSAGDGTSTLFFNDDAAGSTNHYSFLTGSVTGVKDYEGSFSILREYQGDVPAEFDGGYTAFRTTDRITITVVE